MTTAILFFFFIQMKVCLKLKLALFYSVVRGKMYLFGGSCHPEAKECLPGVYCFDIGKNYPIVFHEIKKDKAAIKFF